MPSITKTLFGGGAPGFDITSTIKLKYDIWYWPITFVLGWTEKFPYKDPSTSEFLSYPES